jgi:transketolase
MRNNNFRKRIVDMVADAKMGHIPSSFSIVEIISTLYQSHLKFDPSNPKWEERDIFILSKGHGCVALYVVLKEQGFLTENDLNEFCTPDGILGEHPDFTRVPGVEASTGSLGHGLPFAIGIALALKIQKKPNKVYVLVGDGECHEGTIWEAANVANNLRLGNLCVVVDWNGSASQLMPRDKLPEKWRAFGWETQVVNGHDESELTQAFSEVKFDPEGSPHVLLAETVKGKGVPMLEGHGPWHHKIPNEEEYKVIMEALS